MSSRGVTRSVLMLLAAAFCGCAAAMLDVVSPVPMEVPSVTLAIHDDTAGDVSPDQMRDFKRTITRQLIGSGIEVLPSARRGSVLLVGSVLRFDPGIRALRFVSRYGFGTGALESEWDVEDGRGNVIARCRIAGSVSTGTFGGSFADVQEETGKALARFLKGEIQ